MKITLTNLKFVDVPSGTGLRCTLNAIGFGSVDGCLACRNSRDEITFNTPTNRQSKGRRVFRTVTLEPEVHDMLVKLVSQKFGKYIVHRSETKAVPVYQVNPYLETRLDIEA